MTRRNQRLPACEDVLSGRVTASIEQLFALIHAANPTDLGLSAAEEARRYARKARLQSLLVARFPHALAVQADPRDAGVVSLRHRYADRDACHARLDALDADARRWVEDQLHTSPDAVTPRPLTTARSSPPEASPPEAPPRGPAALLAAGRDALAAYDYDAARAAFEAALRADGGLPAARALLDLLVHHLADDEAALALALPDDTDPVVAEHLATAAARLDDRARAARHLRAVPPPDGADAAALLVDHALRAGALDEARAHLHALRDRDPAHPTLPRLTDAVARARADERRPLEARVEAALDAGDWAAVALLVEELGARWPDSATLRTATRRLDAHRHAEEARALVGKAWTAWDAGDAPSVLAFLARARALAPPEPDLAGWMDEAEAAAREQIELDALSDARAAFAAADLPRALAAARLLSAAARADLAVEHPVPALAWLLRLPDDDASVPAALALAAAEAAVASAPDTVPALLAPHARLLRNLPDGRALLARAEAAVDARAEAAAAAALAEFDAAMAAGDFPAAARLLPALAPARRRAAEERLSTAQRRVTHAAEEAAALERGDLLAARAHARARGAVTDLDARVRAAWHVTVLDGLDLPSVTVNLPGDGPHPRPLLDADGTELVSVDACAELLVARIVDLRTRRVRRVLSWRLPAQFVLGYVQRAGDVLSVLSVQGALFEARLSDGDVVRWLPAPADLADADIGGVTLAPGGQHVWVSLATVALGYQTRVYDTARWPAYTVLERHGFCVPLLGADEPTLLRLDPERGGSLYGPYGRAIGRRIHSADFRHTRAAVHPRGRGVCTLLDATPRRVDGLRTVPADLRDRAVDEPVGFFAPLDESDQGRVHIFPLFSIRSDHELATERSRARLHLKASAGNFCAISTYVLDDDGTLDERADTLMAPLHTRFVTDIDGRIVRAFAPAPDGLIEVDLDDRDSREDSRRAQEETNATVFPGGGFGADLGEDAGLDKRTDAAEMLVRALRAVPERDRRAWVDEQLRLHAEDPTTLLDLAAAAVAVDFRLDPERAFDAVLRRFPDHPRRRYLTAQLEARRGRWSEVLALLDGLSPEDLDVRYQSHLLHLRGVARLRHGDRAGAERDLRACLDVPEPCDPGMAFALLDVLDGCEVLAEPTDTPTWRRARLADIVRAILAADDDLAADRPADAVARLTTARIWRWTERQSRARLAEAWLRLPAADPDARAARHVALTGFLALHAATARGDGNDLPLLAHTWDTARLDTLADRVRADLGLPAPPDDPLVFREEAKGP